LQISTFHAPPVNARRRVTNFHTALLAKSFAYYYAITLGDLNARHVALGCRGTNKHGRRLLQFLSASDLVVLNDTNIPTFTHSALPYADTIDYCIATSPVAALVQSCSITPDIGSDHFPISLKLTTLRQNNIVAQEHTPNIRLTRWEDFRNQLDEFIRANDDIWPTIEPSTAQEINTLADALVAHVSQAIRENTPLNRPANPMRPRLPPEILLLIRSRRSFRKEYAWRPSSELRRKINEYNKSIKQHLRALKKSLLENKARVLKRGPRYEEFWPTAKNLLRAQAPSSTFLRVDNAIITNPAEKTDKFTAFYKEIYDFDCSDRFDETFKRKVETELADTLSDTSTPQGSAQELASDLTEAELGIAILSLKRGKAPGPDGIRYEHISVLNFRPPPSASSSSCLKLS
jgi:hypothetical protein